MAPGSAGATAPYPGVRNPVKLAGGAPDLYVSYNLAVVREISDTVWVFTTAGCDDLPVI